ncbi:hypothetical protein [Streptomyces agglomeratus]|uniref:hypothetical protein n=1 Tax=Streptomyces agglomeratus TaxID=285458 RepID=UPI0023E3A15F|nr:hypothetical protein [Streptomyces agglomeratus]
MRPLRRPASRGRRHWGTPHPSWRGVPIYPCGESLVSQARTASTLCMRTGEDNQGVIGLRRSRIPGRERSSRKEG